jgi:hypothetical protein
VKCQLDRKTGPWWATRPRSRRATSTSPAFCAVRATTSSPCAPKVGERFSYSGMARRDDVLAFYRQGAAVPPLAFSATIKDMKALLHNA